MVDKILIVEMIAKNMLVHSIYDNVNAARIAFDENFTGKHNDATDKSCRAGEYYIVSVREYLESKLKPFTVGLLNELEEVEAAQNQYDLIMAERGYCTLPPRYYGNEVTLKEFLE